MSIEDLKEQIIEEIHQTTDKIKALFICKELDIKQMQDLQRYTETRKNMIHSLNLLDKVMDYGC